MEIGTCGRVHYVEVVARDLPELLRILEEIRTKVELEVVG